MRRLKNTKNATMQEGSWTKLWTEIKEWAYVDNKPAPAREKIQHNTIVNYVNAPLMASFAGTKETTVKFIISRYHNGRFYFDQPVDISGEFIYKLTGLSNKGDLVPIGTKEGLVKKLTASASGKNSKGLMISQITARTSQIVAKIIAITLTMASRGSNLKLDMLEAVDTIATNGKIYRWAEYVANMIKTIYDKCQETGGIFRFPSLILWMVIFYIFLEENKNFQEPTKFHMWIFKPFSQKGTMMELANRKVLLEN